MTASAKRAAARPPALLPCAGCQARAEEVAFLRERVCELERALVAGSPQGPALAQQQREQAGVKIDPDRFVDPHSGLAYVLIDGQQVPYTEWRRGEEALAAALAGKAIEIPADNGGVK